jgi:O-acetyl-ADP-ribose deacetylase (regulator of RNase III)
LPAKWVIHTVGPIWRGGNNSEPQLLQNAYLNSLKLAADNGVQAIAFPNISTGVYGFPKEKAAVIAIETVKKYLADHLQISQVYFVCFDSENYELYRRLLNVV